MDINRALEIMGYSSIIELREAGTKGLRKKFVYLVRGKHPDDAGRDADRANEFGNRLIEINEAYEVLKKTAKLPVFNSNKNKTDVKILNIEELCKIYTGERDSVYCMDGTLINKAGLRQYSVLLQVDIRTSINRLDRITTVYMPWNVIDRYEVSIESKESNPTSETEISVQIGNMVRTITTKATSVKIPIAYKSVNIFVSIERVMNSE